MGYVHNDCSNFRKAIACSTRGGLMAPEWGKVAHRGRLTQTARYNEADGDDGKAES